MNLPNICHKNFINLLQSFCPTSQALRSACHEFLRNSFSPGSPVSDFRVLSEELLLPVSPSERGS